MSFDVKVRKTGAKKRSAAFRARGHPDHDHDATDTQTQQSGSMAITNDMWMVPEIPGYDQVRDFYKRMARRWAMPHHRPGLRLQQDAGAESRRRAGS